MSTPSARRNIDAVTAFFGAGTAIAVLGVLAWTTSRPFLFPSLGASAYLAFMVPAPPAAQWRNLLIGHGVGLLSGLAGLLLFGLRSHPGAFVEGVSAPRVAATAVAVAMTAGVLVGLGRPHPPAGATSLIVSLGVLRTNRDLVVLALAVVVLAAVLEALRAAAALVRRRVDRDR